MKQVASILVSVVAGQLGPLAAIAGELGGAAIAPSRLREAIADGISGLESGGVTPAEVAPDRFKADAGRPELVNSWPGTEEEAYRHAILAGVSYCQPASIEGWACHQCRQYGDGVQVVGIFSGAGADVRAVLLRDSRRSEIVVSLRGSVSVRNYLHNFVYEMARAPYARGARVHSGIKEASDEILGHLLVPLRGVLDGFPGHRLVVTGHSLGGAMATLMASELGHRRIVPWGRMALATYGEPRIGNLQFARWLNAQRVQMTRVVNENDFIPQFLLARNGFVHHATEMYIHNNRSKVCSTETLEDVACSLARFPNLSGMAHLWAWDLGFGVITC